jgi:hypothetical protein
MRVRALSLLLLLCIGQVAWAEPHSSDPHKERARLVARSLTQEATLSFDRRDFAKTQMLLEAAYMLYASEKIQYSLARVYEAQGQKLLAMRSYQQFLRKVGLSERLPGQTEDATGAIARLQKDLGHLVFSRALSSPVRLDEEVPLPRGSLDAWVEPGTHRLVMSDDLEQLSISAGETKTVKVSDSSEAPITTSDVAAAAPSRKVVRPGLRAAKWTLGVLGIGALGIGGTLVGIDGLRRCNDFPGECNDPLATRWPGVGLLVGGGVMVGISAVLFGVDSR